MTWQRLKQTGRTISLSYLLSLYIICADFQISLTHLRRFFQENDQIILSRLDLKSCSRFFWAFTAHTAKTDRRGGVAAICTSEIASVVHAGSNEWALCIGCNGAGSIDMIYNSRQSVA